MSYEKVNGIPAAPNEQVVLLDSGDYVAVSCTLSRVPSGVAFHAKARAVDKGGMPILDAKTEKLTRFFGEIALGFTAIFTTLGRTSRPKMDNT